MTYYLKVKEMKMKITKRQIQKLVQNELNESRRRAPARSDVVSIDVDGILKEQSCRKSRSA